MNPKVVMTTLSKYKKKKKLRKIKSFQNIELEKKDHYFCISLVQCLKVKIKCKKLAYVWEYTM